MRQVALDIEVTGINLSEGHRIIEIAGIELIDGKLTGKQFHHYINPQRLSDKEALVIHGLSNEFLSDKPVFKEMANDFLQFIDGDELIIHHAPFDVDFINKELEVAGIDEPDIQQRCKIIDTYVLAKEKFPGMRNTLNVLCGRFEIDTGDMAESGALLDAMLLVEVYRKLVDLKSN